MTTPQEGNVTTQPFRQDLIDEIFGERPELAFLGRLGQSGLKPNQADFLRGRASDFLQKFQQALGGQLTQGQLPSLTPDQFFGNLNFRNELFNFSPEERGLDISRFSPRTRFLF